MADSKVVKPAATRRPPAAGKGRAKGSLNKTTKTAKEAIALAAEKLGGADRLVAWAKEDKLNERAFWATIYPKLLPLQVTGENGGPVETKATLNVSGLPTEVLAQIMKAQDATKSS